MLISPPGRALRMRPDSIRGQPLHQIWTQPRAKGDCRVEGECSQVPRAWMHHAIRMVYTVKNVAILFANRLAQAPAIDVQ